ncbi:MAG: 4Fe-4S dicluster domain-containing protein [Deltaproteobacteria bacterium]|nr:4Fe-4S dicluster domain-containing protein [Deltaproteobacteria bacterium]
MITKIGREKLQEFVAGLMKSGRLFAPVKEGKGTNFKLITDPQSVTLDFYNTIQSPKAVLFPQSEDLVNYNISHDGIASEPAPIDDGSRIILGVRPCDVQSFEIMDRLFNGSGIVDPYWSARRSNLTIIAYAFDRADPVDFYNAFGITGSDEQGSDILMVRDTNSFLFKAFTDKGTKLLETMPFLEKGTADDEKRMTEIVDKGRDIATRTLDTAEIHKRLAGIFDSPYWEEAAAACLNCGVCTYVCPTCHCFDIQDETLFGEGSRRKIWDSCMFSDFTLHASGHNPRTKKSQRLRQRINHKFSYYVENFGIISCVGCGRCTRSCPVNIDILTVVEEAR